MKTFYELMFCWQSALCGVVVGDYIFHSHPDTKSNVLMLAIAGIINALAGAIHRMHDARMKQKEKGMNK